MEDIIVSERSEIGAVGAAPSPHNLQPMAHNRILPLPKC